MYFICTALSNMGSMYVKFLSIIIFAYVATRNCDANNKTAFTKSCGIGFIFYIMQIRRRFLHTIVGDKETAKALSLGLYIKSMYVSSTITQFSYSKLHRLTGLHITTLKKRVAKLRELGFAIIKNGCLIIRKLKSSDAQRNIQLANYTNIKDIENALFAQILIEIQRRKNFVKHLLRLRYSPSNNKDLKKANIVCKRYGLLGKKFSEKGISYKTIAQRMGLSIRKAFDIVNWAVDNNIISKRKNQRRVRIYGNMAHYDMCKGATFYTNKYAYKILSNTYTINVEEDETCRLGYIRL